MVQLSSKVKFARIQNVGEMHAKQGKVTSFHNVYYILHVSQHVRRSYVVTA